MEHKKIEQKNSNNENHDCDFESLIENGMIVHIMNGLIMIKNGTKIYPMIEFKIKQKDNSNVKILFERVNYHCGWFYLNLETEKHQLVGPFKLDLEKIKSESVVSDSRQSSLSESVRIINDDLIPEINGLEITDVSDDESSLIPSSDYPEWIKHFLAKCITIKKDNQSEEMKSK